MEIVAALYLFKTTVLRVFSVHDRLFVLGLKL